MNPTRYCKLLHRERRRLQLASTRAAKRLRDPSPLPAPSAKRSRPMRSCAKRQLAEEERVAAERRSASESRSRRVVTTKRGETGKARAKARGRMKRKLAYASVEAAVGERKLFHSVVQHPVTMREIRDGDDSDEGTRGEMEWRQKLDDEEVLDYVDTIPIEKLFMNLWNQFMNMEFFAYADRRVARACHLFATSKFLCCICVLRVRGWRQVC